MRTKVSPTDEITVGEIAGTMSGHEDLRAVFEELAAQIPYVVAAVMSTDDRWLTIVDESTRKPISVSAAMAEITDVIA